MAVVVSDAGPLIALARIDSLFIPKRLFSRIRIPEAVWFECREKPGEDSRRIERAANEGWLSVDSVSVERPYPPSLGRGEVEAIQLARESAPSLLIMDDRLARREAIRLGLDHVGTARLAYLAERASIIDDAESLVRRMTEGGYRISPQVLERLKAKDVR